MNKVHAHWHHQGLPGGFIQTDPEASDYTATVGLMAHRKPEGLFAERGCDDGGCRETKLIQPAALKSHCARLSRLATQQG
jgi:hypothetical protein